jgi:hypothetical protein
MKRLLVLLVALAFALPARAIDVNGYLNKAALENKSTDPSTTLTGRVYWNTTVQSPKVYNGTSWVTLGSGAAVSPTAQSYGPSAVTAVGTAGFPQLGHVLTAADFTAFSTSNYSFYPLGANATDGNATNAQNLTVGTAPTYGVAGIAGTSTAASFNGTTQSLGNDGSFYRTVNGKSLYAAAWFYKANWQEGAVRPLLAWGDNVSDHVLSIWLDNANSHIWVRAEPSAGGSWTYSYDTGLILPAAAGWHHIGFVYDAVTTTGKLYLEGKVVWSVAISGLRNASTTGFRLGTWTSAFYLGSVEELATYIGTTEPTDDDIRKLAARRFDHNKGIATNSQLWSANWGRSDLQVGDQLDSSWLVSKSTNSLWADFSGVATGAFVDLSLQNTGLVGTQLFPNSTYDSGVLSTTPATTIAHNLGSRPASIVYEYETSTGHFTPLQGSNFCEADSTSLYCDWTGLSVSASNRLEIIAGGVPLLSSVPMADATTNGIVNSNGAQTIGSAKTFTGLVDASATSGGVKVEGARSSPLVSDSQNVYSGTWTPTLIASSGFTTLANVVGVPGSWMRVGNVVTASFQINSGGGTNINGGAIVITGTHPIARASGTGNVAGTCAGATTVALAPPLRITESSATQFTVQSAGGTSSGGNTFWACTYTYVLN